MARSIDSQDRALDEQDRAIEQQGQRMQQQRQQLEQLRGYQGDTVAYNDSGQTINRGSFGSPSNPNGPSEPRGQLRQTAPLRETDLVPPTAWESDITVTNPNAVNSGLIPQAKLPPVERAGLVERTGPVEMDTQMALNQPPPQAEAMGQAAALAPQGSQSVECNQAADEVAEAKKNTDSADKLFHYRRALRLCPDNPQYHNGLGEVYVALGRIEDAEYEFREALKIVPGYEPADRNLQGLRSAKY